MLVKIYPGNAFENGTYAQRAHWQFSSAALRPRAVDTMRLGRFPPLFRIHSGSACDVVFECITLSKPDSSLCTCSRFPKKSPSSLWCGVDEFSYQKLCIIPFLTFTFCRLGWCYSPRGALRFRSCSGGATGFDTYWLRAVHRWHCSRCYSAHNRYVVKPVCRRRIDQKRHTPREV